VNAATRPGTQVVLAMIGSVCGALLTGALNTSPTGRLIGAALGAAIPTLVGYAGPYGKLRVGAGIGVTALALFLTYGGFTLFDYAADRSETFPLPSAMPDPQGVPSIVTKEDGLSLEVTPKTVQCSGDRCDEVTVTSTGEKLLKIDGIEFVGDAAEEFSHGGDCDSRSLRKDEECRVAVSFTPSGVSGTRNAILRIHQNLSGPATDVAVESEVEGGGGFRVVEVFLDVEPSNWTGPCPVPLKFRGRISVDGGAGIVAYKFGRSDGASTLVKSLTFEGPGSQPVETTWQLGAPGSEYQGWESILILDPQLRESNQAKFTVNCT
jgi:hypothetical protein